MATLPEAKRYVISEQPSGDAPRLMLIYHQKLAMDVLARIHQELNMVLELGVPIVLDGGIEVFQLIDGKWLHLDGSIELEDAPIPQKVNFREFL